MASNDPDLDVFRSGTRQLIQGLSGDANDETVESTIRYIITAIGPSADKLKALVDIIYFEAAPHSNRAASLFVHLLQLVPDHISATISPYLGKRQPFRNGQSLARYYILHKCQDEFEETITFSHWHRRPFDVISMVTQLSTVLFTTKKVNYDLLHRASLAEHLFEPHNFNVFVDMVTTFGPELDNTTPYSIAPLLDMIATRASAGTRAQQLMVAGLIDMRDNNFKIRTKAKQIVNTAADIQIQRQTEL